MRKIPVSLIIDDPAPVVSVYYTHALKSTTEDGRPLLRYVPNEIFFEFCDVIERRGMKGKFSVVPMPGNEGDIINGLNGVDEQAVRDWLDGVKKRVMPAFSVGPEMLTHNKAVDLATGEELELNERDWASTQDRTTLTPYISKAFSILKEAGFASCGVTSPWDFAIEVEEEYVQAISQAVWDVYGQKNAWYFLRALRDTPNAKPWVAYDDGDRCVVSIPATTQDHIWQTIDTTESDEAYVSRVADEIITSDGKDGEMIRVLETGGYPILITHWQSLVSNGLATGMKVLDEVGKRVNENLSDRVEWKSFEEILEMVVNDKDQY